MTTEAGSKKEKKKREKENREESRATGKSMSQRKNNIFIKEQRRMKFVYGN